MSEFIPNGALIGRYRILMPIGQGGMATVYKVTDTVLERDVALKLIRIDQFPPAILDIVLKRFEREAKALARLNHPNIVKIHDYGEHENAPYLVMDFLPGQSFKQIRKPVPYKLAIHLIRPIADALAYAHRQGIFHRDVKPGNIMLTSEGTPILTDFGIAKLLDTNEEHTLTASGIGIGTPEYMAPEQGLGDEIDGRADQYSLAIVLYELITGHKPFQSDTPLAIILKRHTEPLPPMREFVSDVPESVEAVIRRALAKSPDQRFPDMTSFVRALEDVILPGSSQVTIPAPASVETHIAEPQPHSENVQSTIPEPAPTETPIFDAQPRPESDTVPVMPFNTGPESKVKNQAAPQPKKKPQLATWLVPVVLLVSIGAFFFLRRPADTPVFIPSETASRPTETSAPFPTDAFTATFTPTLTPTDTPSTTFTPTVTTSATFTPTASLTPTVSVEVTTVSDFLEKKEYAYLGAYIRNITDTELQEELRQFVYDDMFDDEIKLTRYQGRNEKYGYFNIFGEVVIQPQFGYGESSDFSNGLAAVKINTKCGYINTQGDVVIDPQFDPKGKYYWGGCQDFSEGLAAVKKNDLWGYINTLGEFVIELMFDHASSFSEGLAAVKKNDLWGYINTLGEFVIEPMFDHASSFSEGLAAIKKNDLWGYINTLGEFVIEPMFDHASSFSEGLATVEIYDGYWRSSSYINASGEIVLEERNDYSFSNGLALFRNYNNYNQTDQAYGYINQHGETVVESKFDVAYSFSEGLAAVKTWSKWGYINTLGEFAIEPQFDEAESFSNGIAQVQKEGVTYFIDPTGETVFVACKR